MIVHLRNDHLAGTFTMRTFTLAFAAALLLTAPAVAADNCSLKQVADLTLTAQQGWLTVPVTIGGKQYPFIVSIENAHSSVAPDIADLVQARTKHLPDALHVKLLGQEIQSVAYLPDLTIGSAQGANEEMVLLREAPPAGAKGSIGLDILASFDMELDLSAGKLRLFSQDHCDGEVVYWNKPYDVVPFTRNELGNPVFTATLDGKQVPAGFAVQVGTSFLGMGNAKLLLGLAPDDPKLEPVPGSDPKIGYVHYPFKSLTLGGIAINDPRIVIYPQPSSCVGKVQMRMDTYERCFSSAPVMLGRNILSKLHVFFAFKEKNLYFTASDTTPAAANPEPPK